MYPVPTLGPQIWPQAPGLRGGSITAGEKDGVHLNGSHTWDQEVWKERKPAGLMWAWRVGGEALNTAGPARPLSAGSPRFHSPPGLRAAVSPYQPGCGAQASTRPGGFLSSAGGLSAPELLGSPPLSIWRALLLVCLVWRFPIPQVCCHNQAHGFDGEEPM